MQETKTYLFKILILIFTLILFFGIFEITLRIFFPQNLNIYTYDEDIIFKLIPNSHITYFIDDSKVDVKINSKGLRDHEYPYEKYKKRILVLGDSFVEGLQIPLNETFTKQLENTLKNYEVISAGVSSYGSSQEITFLEKEGYKYKPDIVILSFYVWNDVYDNLAKNTLESKPKKVIFIKKILSFLRTKFHSLVFISNTLHEFSYVINQNKSLVTDEYTDGLFLTGNDKDLEYGWNNTKKIILEGKKFSDSINSTFVLLIIPTKEQIDEEQEIKYFSAKRINLTNLDMDKPQRILDAFAKENNLFVIDLLPEFKEKNINNTFYYNNDIHWNKQGHKLAAQIIYENLINDNLV